jgi:hypothetical protein
MDKIRLTNGASSAPGRDVTLRINNTFAHVRRGSLRYVLVSKHWYDSRKYNTHGQDAATSAFVTGGVLRAAFPTSEWKSYATDSGRVPRSPSKIPDHPLF